MMGSCVLVGTCGNIQSLWRPKVLHLRPSVPPWGPNVTLEEHDVTLEDEIRV
jgi:hypothetical protein